jgi:hypothetical protein
VCGSRPATGLADHEFDVFAGQLKEKLVAGDAFSQGGNLCGRNISRYVAPVFPGLMVEVAPVSHGTEFSSFHFLDLRDLFKK